MFFLDTVSVEDISTDVFNSCFDVRWDFYNQFGGTWEPFLEKWTPSLDFQRILMSSKKVSNVLAVFLFQCERSNGKWKFETRELK